MGRGGRIRRRKTGRIRFWGLQLYYWKACLPSCKRLNQWSNIQVKAKVGESYFESSIVGQLKSWDVIKVNKRGIEREDCGNARRWDLLKWGISTLGWVRSKAGLLEECENPTSPEVVKFTFSYESSNHLRSNTNQYECRENHLQRTSVTHILRATAHIIRTCKPHIDW